ncbi:hypothetical protein MMC25_005471 [Agyrium rufum]|nr:hypothetical protein [Agyrium rufum]
MPSSSNSSRLVQLASIISENTNKVDEYLTTNKLPKPSFEIDSPVQLTLPKDIQSARDAVINANMELSELLMGPKEVVTEYPYNWFVSLQAVYSYGMATAFPVGEEATFAQIAEKCKLNEPDTRRVLRHAMAFHVFKEVRKGVVAHTNFSKLMAEDPAFRDFVGIGSDDMWIAAAKTVPAMLKWPNSQETTKTGFSLANDTEDSMYTFLGKHPEKAMRFAGAMSLHVTNEGMELSHIIDNGPWASLPTDGLVVDIGGSHGDCMIAVADKFPFLRFIVQDLPATIQGHPPLPKGLENCVIFQEHDFFTEQPVKGADLYFFRWIFHNWPDKYCLQILKNLVPALKPGARVLVNEYCLPEPNTVMNRTERRVRGMDIAMMTIQNSQERDQDDWISLFKRADERFKFEGVKHPEGAHLSFIEFHW